MKALSIRQPWAWLIVNGYKDIENRNWRTNFRGRVYVHAGKRPDWESLEYIEGIMTNWDGRPDAFAVIGPDGTGTIRTIENPYIDHLIGSICRHDPGAADTLGAIVGEVDIIDCVTESPSPWFVGPYGFRLVNPVAYDEPIPCRGSLGFFKPCLKAALLY